MRHSCVIAAAGLAALLVLPGCATSHRAESPQRTIDVFERDFRITAPRHVRAGNVTLHVVNKGPNTHELILVRLRTNQALPVRSDGMTVDEDALRRDAVGMLEAGGPGSVRTLRVRLEPGEYELFCNMSGHFMGGMARRIAVS